MRFKMKNIGLVILFVLFFSMIIHPQKGKWKDDEAKEKLEQLEKIKLIEVLQMDEETTLRFFSRKSEHKKQQEELHKQLHESIDYLETIFKSGRAVTNDELKTNIAEINNLQLQIEKNRIDFINSLNDILSYEQIAKLIIFEKQFRNEVRRLIMKERRAPIDQE